MKHRIDTWTKLTDGQLDEVLCRSRAWTSNSVVDETQGTARYEDRGRMLVLDIFAKLRTDDCSECVSMKVTGKELSLAAQALAEIHRINSRPL